MDETDTSFLKHNWKVIKEGLIKLPIETIDSWIDSHTDEILSKIKETYLKGYNTFVDDEIVFINPYNNEEVRVPVNIQNKLRSVNDETDTALYFDKKENAIYLSAKALVDNLETKNKIKEYVKNGIHHELTHVIDPGRRFKTQKHDTFSDYVNSDIEFPAFLQQYIQLIKNKGNSLKVLNAIRTGKKIPIPEIANWFNNLTTDNKRKFIKELVKELQ